MQVLMLTCFSTAFISYDEVDTDTSLAVTALYKTIQIDIYVRILCGYVRM